MPYPKHRQDVLGYLKFDLPILFPLRRETHIAKVGDASPFDASLKSRYVDITAPRATDGRGDQQGPRTHTRQRTRTPIYTGDQSYGR